MFLDLLLLLFDGLYEVKTQYMVQEEKQCKNVETSGNSLYHEIVCPG